MSDLHIVGRGPSLETASEVAQSLGFSIFKMEVGSDLEAELVSFAQDNKGAAIFLALGPNHLNYPRSTAVKSMLAKGMQQVSLVSPLASIHPTSKIGKGVFVGPFSSIGASAQVSDGVWVDAHAMVSQSSILGSFCWLGARSTINGSKIGTHATIGSGVTVGKIEVGARCVLEKPLVYDKDLPAYTHYLENMPSPIVRL